MNAISGKEHVKARSFKVGQTFTNKLGHQNLISIQINALILKSIVQTMIWCLNVDTKTRRTVQI
jgi:hypothetical protein